MKTDVQSIGVGKTWRVRRSGAYAVLAVDGERGRRLLSLSIEAPGVAGVDAIGLLLTRDDAVTLLGRLGRMIDETWPEGRDGGGR